MSSLVRRGLYRFSDRLACRIISDGDHPYLERYFLFEAFGLTAYLHRFVGSDPDRGLHDHPWPWACSVLLCGHYLERRRHGERLVTRLNLITGDTFHRVIMVPESRSVWTLFIHRSKRSKSWGFWYDRSGGVADQPVTDATWVAHSSSTPARWWLQAPHGRSNAQRQPAEI